MHEGIRRRWKKQVTAKDRPTFLGNGKMSPEKEESIRLRQENKPLKMETEILDKAATFLAKESI
jgi:transposase-like protein